MIANSRSVWFILQDAIYKNKYKPKNNPTPKLQKIQIQIVKYHKNKITKYIYLAPYMIISNYYKSQTYEILDLFTTQTT